MAKYDRVEEPVRKAKEFNRIADTMKISEESTLKFMDKQRKFRESSDNELLHFGIDLFEHGYTLDDVRIDLELCAAKREINFDDKSDEGRIKYEGIENVPNYEKMLTIVDNPVLFKSIEIGYNIAYRRNYAKQLDEKYGKSR